MEETDTYASSYGSSQETDRTMSDVNKSDEETLVCDHDEISSPIHQNIRNKRHKKIKEDSETKKNTAVANCPDDRKNRILGTKVSEGLVGENGFKKEIFTDVKVERKRKKIAETGKIRIKKEEQAACDGSNDAVLKKKKSAKRAKPENGVWKWWEEEAHPDGVKWLTLEHNGPYFSPPYEKLPDNINFYYDGKKMKLSIDAEEVAGFYATMLDHEYTTREVFNKNFLEDWRSVMTSEETKVITSLEKCDFREIHEYYKMKREEKKNMSKEEKTELKKENEEIVEKYGYCMMDGHKQKIGNFRIEPPGLFRGRGDHPKQGKLKLRICPEDITINIGENCPVPPLPAGSKWKAIVHDNKVTWLAQWIENVSGSYKYVMLNPTARIKGEKDMGKYDLARQLHTCIDTIRENYCNDMSSQEMKIRQRAVALYFIDRLALRAGHEKEDGESADTVGCCSLRVEHITLHKEDEGKKYVVEFDFLGKDSIRYYNKVSVEKKVFKNLILFKKGKVPSDDLFDRLNTNMLNKYLGELMPGLSAKVFRTYNASTTLQEQLKLLTKEDSSVVEKFLSYNRANRAVAILCNHQRTVPKTFEKTVENMGEKIKKKKAEMKEFRRMFKKMKNEGADLAKLVKLKERIKRVKEQFNKLEISLTDKEENKEVALGTSKLNYLDPRISVAWCKSNDVPIEKIYNKTQREKFQWAIEMTDESFIF